MYSECTCGNGIPGALDMVTVLSYHMKGTAHTCWKVMQSSTADLTMYDATNQILGSIPIPPPRGLQLRCMYMGFVLAVFIPLKSRQ